MIDKYYSLVSAANMLNIPKLKLYTMVKDGTLPFHQPAGKGGKIYIHEDIVLNSEEYIIDIEADKNYRNMLSRMGYKKI